MKAKYVHYPKQAGTNHMVEFIESWKDHKIVIQVLEEEDKCSCEGWGCRQCCVTDEEIRARQGIFG